MKQIPTMLIATINCSIGDKKNHLNAETIKNLLQGKEPTTNLEKYALDVINSEATQQEIEAFIEYYFHNGKK